MKSAAILYLYHQLKYSLVIINLVQDLYIKSHFVFILIKDPVERSAIRI